MPSANFKEKAIDLFSLLDDEGIDWVLVGAEAMNLYVKRPRATVDVDIVVRKKDLRRVRKVLERVCVDLKETEVHWHGVLSKPPMLLELDVIKSTSHELFETALDRKVLMGGVQVVPVECLLALKYLAAVSALRSREDKGRDILDFMVTFRDNKKRLNRRLLIDLASRAHQNAREEFLAFLDAVENKKPITL